MRRIPSIALMLALAVLIEPQLVYAQQAKKPARIGILRISEPPPQYLAAFRAGMAERGHKEGKTYLLIPGWRRPGEKKVKDSVLARRLAAKGIDLIVTVGSRMARAASRAAPNTPIVMASAGDPLRSRLVRSLARPGGNITGMTAAGVEASAKGIEVIKQLVPGIRRVAAIHRKRGKGTARRSSAFPDSDKNVAKALGIDVVYHEVSGGDDFDVLFERLKGEGIDALSIRSGGSFTKAQRKRMAEAALRAKLPSVTSSILFVRLGGLVSLGTDRRWLFRRAAAYVDLILKGAKPGELPVERPREFRLVLNARTAKALGIKVPHHMLLRSDEVIQ
ncbi:MAG: ABC transporter substrate-binding protein [Alphaproteobacteria bacterium]|nr:ABC transporter substrate-binding protein [Alphaproteobacteria bacterium]